MVAEYVAQSRRAARDAVERAFGASSSSLSKRVGKSDASAAPKMSRKPCERRRPPEEVAQLGERLLELVRARPGESMVAFAAELDLRVRELQRPMSLLKREGRVRPVGQKRQMRYFPALRKAAAARLIRGQCAAPAISIGGVVPRSLAVQQSAMKSSTPTPSL